MKPWFRSTSWSMLAIFLATSVLSSACSPTADRSEAPAPPAEPPDAVLRSRLEGSSHGCCTEVTVLVDFTIAVSGTVASTTSTPEDAEKLCAFVATEAESVFGRGKTIEVSLHTAEGARVCSLSTEASSPSTVEDEQEKESASTRPPSLPPSEEEEQQGL